MRIAIVGTGYVGLVSGACFAEFGNDVICVDIDTERIALLRGGSVPFFEPQLEALVGRNARAGRLQFTTELGAAINRAEIIFLAVGTPPGVDGQTDLSAVLLATRQIAEAAQGPKILVTKSTVPVGTGDQIEQLVKATSDHPIQVVSNPEFLKEGDAVNDFLKPDRVIIGTDDEQARQLLTELYAPYMRTRSRTLFMSRRSAELTKYAANGLLATKISFMNDIARLCDEVGADVSHIRLGLGADPRIGPHFLFPGVGFGGSCFPKDVAALCYTGQKHGVPQQIMEAVLEINALQKRYLVQLVQHHFGADLSGRRFAIWGLAFKPGTDDMREAPSITIIEGLLAAGASVCAHDPEAISTARQLFDSRIDYADDAYAACDHADALLVVTEWRCYRNPDFARIAAALEQPVLFDGRNIFRPQGMRERGFTHYTIGRGE